jgi:hypothetical protein
VFGWEVQSQERTPSWPLFTPFGPGASFAGGMAGAVADGILGSAFDNPCAGQLNCQEVVPLIIGDRSQKHPTGGSKSDN